MGSQSTTAHAQRSKSATAVAVWLLGLTVFFAVAPMTAHARWYDPERGRFMSREPLGIDGPNLYHFVRNDPVNFVDPNGLATTGICRGEELENAKKAARHCRSKCKGCGLWTPWDRRGCGSKANDQAVCMQNCLKNLPSPYKEAAKKCVSVFTVNHYSWTLFGFSWMHSQAQFYVNGGYDISGRNLGLHGTTDTCSDLKPPSNNPNDPGNSYPLD